MIIWNTELQLPDNLNLKPSANWGSLMHGMLIEHLPETWQEALHAEGLRPFSQWIEPLDARRFRWHLCVYADDLAETVDAMLTENAIWHCRRLDADMTFTKIERESISLQQYMKRIFTKETAPDRLRLYFRTTTSHKVQGQYQLFPDVGWIGGSLRKHIMELDTECVLGDDEVFEDILNHTRLTRYELRSGTYDLEGARVYGYRGWIELNIKGPDAMRRLAYMLFAFAPYSGAGIKTALGMGGCTIEIIESKA